MVKCRFFTSDSNGRRAAWRRCAWIRGVFVLAICFPSAACLAQLGNTPWPKALGNSGNSGQGFGYGTTNKLKWSRAFGIGATGNSAPAIGADGTVYIGCADSNLYALSGATGVLKWKYPTGGPVNSSPAVGLDGTVYFASTDSKIYAVTSAGGPRWTYALTGDYGQSPALGSDGTLYIGTAGGEVLALDGATGSLQWSFNTGGSIQCVPAIGPDGTVYITSGTQDIYALDGPTGVVQWTFDAGGQLTSPVVGPDGTVYVGSSNDSLYAIDGPSGKVAWSYATHASVAGTPAIGFDGVVYFGSGDIVYALNSASGKPAWTFSASGPVVSAPLIGLDGTVYIGSLDNNMYALNGATGAQVWAYASGGVQTGPAMGADGTLYFSTFDADFYALASAYVPPTPTTVGLSSNSILGGSSVTGAVTLTAVAPYGGAVVALSSGNAAAIVPANVSIAAGQTSASFTVQTSTVGASVSAAITAKLNGGTATATLTVGPVSLESLSLSPVAVTGGSPSTGTVFLNSPAPTGGLQIALQSYYGSATVPSTVTVAAGAVSATLAISTKAVGYQEIDIIVATLNMQATSAVLVIEPASLAAVTVSPSTVSGSSTAQGAVSLTGAAGPGGLAISLGSSSSAAKVPANVIVPAGQTFVDFPVQTGAVFSNQTVTLKAVEGAISVSTSLTVTPEVLKGLKLAPSSVTGGSSVIATIAIVANAPAGGVSVKLSCNQSAAVVPATVNIAAGRSSATFAVNTIVVGAQTTAQISATFGADTTTASLTIVPPSLTSVSLRPTTVKGGASASGTVSMAGLAPAGGVQVALTSGGIAATVPTSVTIPAGKSSVAFSVTTTAVAVTTSTTITATLGSSVKTANLTIKGG